MNIGLDWDGTVTAEPEGFLQFAKIMKALGHKVYVVTMRYPSECADITTNAEWMEVIEKVVATSRGAKASAVSKIGVKINVWIDDHPQAVFMSAKKIWGTCAPEGELHIPDPKTGETIVQKVAIEANSNYRQAPTWNPLRDPQG